MQEVIVGRGNVFSGNEFLLLIIDPETGEKRMRRVKAKLKYHKLLNNV